VTVNGEVHAANETALEHSVEIVMSVYDAQDRVIATGSDYVDADNFFGFEVFSTQVYDVGQKPVKVRIFPKKS
jgi:hypothetical protein